MSKFGVATFSLSAFLFVGGAWAQEVGGGTVDGAVRGAAHGAMIGGPHGAAAGAAVGAATGTAHDIIRSEGHSGGRDVDHGDRAGDDDPD